jgi:hypothetical protein
MKLKRALATGAAVVIAALPLTACGDDDGGGSGDSGGSGSGSSDGGGADAGDSPDDAESDDFCKVFTEMSGLEGGSADDQADAAHEMADKLSDVGTPEDAPEDARKGFEVYVDFLADVDADDIEKLDEADPTDEDAFGDALGLDKDEVADVTAFFTYAATACMPSMEQLPSDFPTQ